MPRARCAVIAVCAAMAMSAFLSTAGTSLVAHAGAGETAVTQDAVIPADVGLHVVDDQILMAGATGFLHRYNFSSQYLWTDYATGKTVPVPALAQANFSSAGGDSVFIRGAINTAEDLTMLDLATMTAQKWTFPAGYAELEEGGDSALAFTKSGGVGSWHELTFGQDGTVASDTTVSGLPSGATLGVSQQNFADATAMIVRYQVSGANQYGLLNLADATVTPIPGATSQPVALTADRVVFYDSATEQVSVYSRAGLLDGSNTAAQTVTLPSGSGFHPVALAGDHVIAASSLSSCQYCGYPIEPVLDIPLSGAASGQALSQAQTGWGSIAQAPDDSVLVVGGTGPADWSVRRLTVDASDAVTNAPVLTLTGPLTNAGLSISGGLVRHIEAYAVPDGTTSYELFDHPLVVGGPPLDGGVLASPVPCATGAACVLTMDSNGEGTSYLTPQTAGAVTLREQIEANLSAPPVTLPSASGTIVDASPEYVIVDGVNPTRQYVAEPNYERVDSSGPVTGAALWFNTLWRADGAGLLEATDLETGVAAKPVPTGANCVASEVQATLRWLYWSCGPNGPAGVYDQRAKVSFAVPAGPMLLGDGYLVQRDSITGDLVMYDVHADSVAAPVTLAASVPGGPAASSSASSTSSADPVADGRGITWAVDKYSGDVAYVAADDSVHVVNAGVPTTPPVIVAPTPAQLVAVPGFFPAKNGGWTQWVTLSRPVTSWTLTFRKAGTGAVAHTESGGATTSPFLSWNGYLPSGAKAYSGTYAWSLSVTTPGSATPVTVPGSTQVVECGQIPFRSYDCDGAPALLAVNGPGGYSHWYNGTAKGGLSDNGATDDWSLCPYALCDTAIVPFGDINGDGHADLLVRTGNGQMRAYLGIGQSYFNPGGGIKSISLGSGWNAYNALVYAGDLNRDGHPDLVARDSAGRLWLLASTGTGRFHTRALIGSGWGGYARLIGAGDLTGDGVGDLLAIDKAGVMWVFVGNGHGGFLPTRYKEGSGWSGYNAVIGIGDLSGDGCNDLVARDTHGTLWRFNGNCKGGFARPVKISTGWQKYQALF